MINLVMLEKKDIIDANINIGLAVKNGLIINDDYDNYRKVQALYRRGLDYYLENQLNLDDYDKIIGMSNLNFGIINSDDRNIFHRTSYLKLNYIYVRNFLYIEKLSFDYLKRLILRVEIGKYDVDEELLYIVSNTFRDVINDNYRRGVYVNCENSCYGSVVPYNIVSSEYLVLAICYDDEFGSISDAEYFSNVGRKESFLANLSKEIETTASAKLGIGVRVLIRIYDEE